MPRLETALTKALDIEHPILLAPMGSNSGGAMASAVTEAGGLGIIGGGYGDREQLNAEIDRAGNSRVGVGFITWAIADKPEIVSVALERQPAALFLSFGDHTPYVDAIKQAGVPLICQVQTLEQAVVAIDSGADVIVAQGQEAGGHGATVRGTIALVPAIVDRAGDIPVVAAGGIADGRGLAAALMLGASGILMGTRFCAAEESLWKPDMKSSVVAAHGDDTIRTSVFDMLRGPDWPSPYDGRAVRNAAAERWHGNEVALRENLEAERAAYAEADKRGDLGTKVVWAGEGVDLIHKVQPAGDIVRQTVDEAVAMLTDKATYSLVG